MERLLWSVLVLAVCVGGFLGGAVWAWQDMQRPCHCERNLPPCTQPPCKCCPDCRCPKFGCTCSPKSACAQACKCKTKATVACALCEGKGYLTNSVNGEDARECPKCHGSGEVPE